MSARIILIHSQTATQLSNINANPLENHHFTLSQAAGIGFDSEELTGFTLDMSYQRTSYKALLKQEPYSAEEF